MSRAQSFKRCQYGCGIVPAHHKCRPTHRMRSQPTCGLTTVAAWTPSQWDAHLKARVEPVVKPAERACIHPPGCTSCNWCGFGAEAKPASGIDHRNVVMNGDTWKLPKFARDLVIDGNCVVNGDEYVYANGRNYCVTKEALLRDGTLISRAPAALDHGGKVLPGDVWEPKLDWDSSRTITITRVNRGTAHWMSARHKDEDGQFADYFFTHATLIARAGVARGEG